MIERLSPFFSLKRLVVLAAVLWTMVSLGAFFWTMVQHEKEIHAIVRQVGRAIIERDVLFRQWNASHGGVYVPVTATTQPNPYLSLEMAPNRDEITLSGQRLTKINPAYMAREAYELARQQGKVAARLISFVPVNPANRPDPWEAKALATLEEGGTEYSEFITVDGEHILRLLMAFRTEKSCLPCHARTGNREGDLRGGISISLPEAMYKSAASFRERVIISTHLIVWLAGMSGIVLGYLLLAPKEAARRDAEQQIINLAYFDALTGLVNRQLFQDRLEHSLALARRHGNRLGVLYVDLDAFKPVNDRFGHEAGDRVLAEAAERLKGCVRLSDTVARVGGDEFVVVLEGLVERQEAGPIAEKLVQAFRAPFLVQGTPCSVGASVGISCYPEDGDDPDVLVQKADSAMYWAKKGGGKRYEFA